MIGQWQESRRPSNRQRRPSPRGAYAAWKQRVAALIESQGPFSGVLRERGIRRLFIAGATPEAAADEAETIDP